MSTSSNIIANIIFDYSSSGLTFGTAPLSSTVAWMVRLSPPPNIPCPLNAVRRLDRQLDSLQRPEPWDGESDWGWYQRKHKYIRVFLAGCRLHERRRRELDAVPHLRRVRHGELTEGYDGKGKVSCGKRRRDGYDGYDPHADQHEVDDSRPAFTKRCTVARWDERDACMASFVDHEVWLGQLLEGRRIVSHLVVNAHASVAHVKPEEKGDMSFLLRLDLHAAKAKAYSLASVSHVVSAASVAGSEDEQSLTTPAPDVMEDQECSVSPSASAAPRSLAAPPASGDVSRRTKQTSSTPVRSAKLRVVSSGKENKGRQRRLEAVEKAKAHRSKREALKSKAQNVRQAQTPEQAATTETVLSSFVRPEALSERTPLPVAPGLTSITEATVLEEVPNPEEPVDTSAASVSTSAYASTSGSSSTTPAALANEVETINDLIATTLASAPLSSPTSAARADGAAEPLNQGQTVITPAASAPSEDMSLDAPVVKDTTPSEPLPQEAPTGGSADVAMEEAIDGTDLPMDTDEPADDPIAVAPATHRDDASGQQESGAEEEPQASADEATDEEAEDDDDAGETTSVTEDAPAHEGEEVEHAFPTGGPDSMAVDRGIDDAPTSSDKDVEVPEPTPPKKNVIKIKWRSNMEKIRKREKAEKELEDALAGFTLGSSTSSSTAVDSTRNGAGPSVSLGSSALFDANPEHVQEREDVELNASIRHLETMVVDGHANGGPSRKGKEKEAAPESKRPITLKLKGWGSTIRKHDEDRKRQADLEDALGAFSLGGSSSSSSVELESPGIVAGPSSPSTTADQTMYVEQDSGYASASDDSAVGRRQKPNGDDAEMPPDSDDDLGGASSA